MNKKTFIGLSIIILIAYTCTMWFLFDDVTRHILAGNMVHSTSSKITEPTVSIVEDNDHDLTSNRTKMKFKPYNTELIMPLSESVNDSIECTEATTAEPIPTESVFDETESSTEETSTTVIECDADDQELVAKIVCREAGGCSTEIQLLVANVIRNRVDSDLFPNTYYDVIHQPYQYGMVYKYGAEWPEWATNDVKQHCRDVARRILEGETVCPANVVFQAEFRQGSGVYAQYDGFYFCYY